MVTSQSKGKRNRTRELKKILGNNSTKEVATFEKAIKSNMMFIYKTIEVLKFPEESHIYDLYKDAEKLINNFDPSHDDAFKLAKIIDDIYDRIYLKLEYLRNNLVEIMANKRQLKDS